MMLLCRIPYPDELFELKKHPFGIGGVSSSVNLTSSYVILYGYDCIVVAKQSFFIGPALCIS